MTSGCYHEGKRVHVCRHFVLQMGKERKPGRKKRKENKSSKNTSGVGITDGDDDHCRELRENEPVTTKEETKNLKTKAKQYDVKDLLEKAEEAIDNFNYELAQKFCERALEVDPDDTMALETAGAVYLEIGDVSSATKCFEHAIEVMPSVGHTKYLSLGQLLEGQDAIKCFQKGIELMIASNKKSSKKRGASAKPDLDVTSLDISSSFCSLAEVYLTDACFADEAEGRCQEYCQKALEYGATNPEAYQVMANYLLSLDNKKEALLMLRKGLELWMVEDDAQDQASIPPFESRITTAKLLLELEDYESAGKVLEGLLEENDEVIEVWYLLGWMCNLAEDKPSARFYLERAKKLAERIGCQDQALLEHVDELLAVLPEGSVDNDDEIEEDEEEEQEQEEEQSEAMDMQ